MAADKVDVDGLKAFRRDLKKYAPAVDKALRKRWREAMKPVIADARAHSPRKSGALARGIRPKITQSEISIVSTAPYARLFEFGGRHPVFGKKSTWVFQPKRPALFNAVEKHREDLMGQAELALKDAEQETLGTT